MPVLDSLAIRLRLWPPILGAVKKPPAKTSPPNTASARTVLFAPGFQVASAAPVPVLDSLAIRLRLWPPIWRMPPT